MKEPKRGRVLWIAAIALPMVACLCCSGSLVFFWNEVPSHCHQSWIATVTHRDTTVEGRHDLMGRCGEDDGYRAPSWARERALDSACNRACRRLGEITVEFVGASQCEVDCTAQGAASYRCEEVEHEHGPTNGESFLDDLFRIPVH